MSSLEYSLMHSSVTYHPMLFYISSNSFRSANIIVTAATQLAAMVLHPLAAMFALISEVSACLLSY